MMRDDVARAVRCIAQEVRPTARVQPVLVASAGGHAIWGVDVYFEPGHSGNILLNTLDCFATWLARQEQAGFTACI